MADEGPKPADGDVQDTSAAETVPLSAGAPNKTRSPSVMSSAAGMGGVPAERIKRTIRGKKVPIVTESWEDGGHLPGFKDGIGVFPPLSDLAALMLELKMRGMNFIFSVLGIFSKGFRETLYEERKNKAGERRTPFCA